MQTTCTSDYVSANYRYIAAYNEVNARIVQRQQALSVYIALIVGLVAALVASSRIEVALRVEWVIWGFPLASVCLVLLNYKYERSLTNLRQYLAELEQLNNSQLILPSYNSETRWATKANRARRFHDLACAILVACCNGIALDLFHQLYPNQFRLTSPLIWLTGLVTLISTGALLLLFRASYRPR